VRTDGKEQQKKNDETKPIEPLFSRPIVENKANQTHLFGFGENFRGVTAPGETG
jgi:hypothetical protein